MGKDDAFKISGVFLLDKHGKVICWKDYGLNPGMGTVTNGSIFTVFDLYIRDNMYKNMDQGKDGHRPYRIMIEGGNEMFIVLLGTGGSGDHLRQDMRRVVDDIQNNYGKDISDCSEDFNEMVAIERELDVLRKCRVKGKDTVYDESDSGSILRTKGKG
jgi:hypothetical protein